MECKSAVAPPKWNSLFQTVDLPAYASCSPLESIGDALRDGYAEHKGSRGNVKELRTKTDFKYR